jgi:hypothetical protein
VTFIFLFTIRDGTLDFEIWVLSEAVFFPMLFLKQLQPSLQQKVLDPLFSGLYPFDDKTFLKTAFFRHFLCENMMKYESLTLNLPLMEICPRQPLAYISDSV